MAFAPAQEQLLVAITVDARRMLDLGTIRDITLFKKHLTVIQVQGHALLDKLSQHHLEITRCCFLWDRYRQLLKRSVLPADKHLNTVE